MLTILFEDDSILAIDKPSGVPSHSLAPEQTSCETLLSLGRPGEIFHLAHRLDTGTSGVLVFAKNEPVYNEIREQFKLKNIQKRYLAWTEKSLEKEQFLSSLLLPYTITWPLAHHAKSKKRMIALPPGKSRNFRGKEIPAVSILHHFEAESFSGIPAVRLEIEIITGVMHQIRVHLGSLGLPLLGDLVYEKSARSETVRLALHAERISFSLNNFRYEIESQFKPTEGPEASIQK
jgi:23S rRNA pseudouridine1911/1915/1917 synthase